MPVLPSLTTVHAGPHTAVRRVELCVNSQAFCIVRRQETIRALPGRPAGLHPYWPPEGQTILGFCRVSSLRSHGLFAVPFIPLTGYRSSLKLSNMLGTPRKWPASCEAGHSAVSHPSCLRQHLIVNRFRFFDGLRRIVILLGILRRRRKYLRSRTLRHLGQ